MELALLMWNSENKENLTAYLYVIRIQHPQKLLSKGK